MNITDMEYAQLVQEGMAALSHGGAFLMSGTSSPNPMTIGWCQWGRIWNEPICTVFVRPSRYSHQNMEQEGYFTVSIPCGGAMKEALGYCGRVSGREENKLQALGLSVLPAQAGGIGGLSGCGIHFECQTLMSLQMTQAQLEMLPEEARRFYNPSQQATPDGDPHTLYFGRVLAAYRG